MSHAEFMRKRNEEDLRSILKTPYGKRFVYRLIKPVFMTAWIQGEVDTTAYNEGRRSLGIALFEEVKRIDPEAYLKMVSAEKKDLEILEQETQDERRDLEY